MKRSKIIISSLIALTGVTLASAVTSTVAWFQYVTRVTAAYTGTSAHCTKKLQMAVEPASGDPTWKTDLLQADLPEADFEPVTSGVQVKNQALAHLYGSPDYRQGAYPWYAAPAGSYSQFTLLIRVADVDKDYGSANQAYLENNVYLTDLTIQNASSNSSIDLEDAVRVHIDAMSPDNYHKYFLFAKTTTSTDVGGQLDINNDGQYDTLGYEWSSNNECIYGVANGKQTSYSSTDANVIGSESSDGSISGGSPIGKTGTSANSYLKVTVTIWLEGWALLEKGVSGNKDSAASSHAVWDSATYDAKSFNVGLTFGVQPHSTDHSA